MIGYSKKNRENYPSESFSVEENEPRVSANQLQEYWFGSENRTRDPAVQIRALPIQLKYHG